MLSEERISPAILSMTVFDPESWDPSEMVPRATSATGALIGTGRIEVFMHDLLGQGSVSLRICVAETVQDNPLDVLEGQLLLSSGALWVDEPGSGSFRSDANVVPGLYNVSVQTPASETDAQIYTVTLFNRAAVD
jgi:hypothetical protein